MSRLTSDAEKLVQAGRSAFRPTDADRERVLLAVMPKLGVGAGAELDVSAHATTAAKATLVKSSAVLVGLGVAGVGLFLALRPEPEPVPAPRAPDVAPKVVPVSLAPRSEPATLSEAAPEPAPADKRAIVTPRPADSRSDNLAQEVAILSRAGTELHGGRAQAALAVLDEHQRKFPGGVLAQERMAARVQALCTLGRTKEAQAELARLTRLSPNSPHEARARKACGAALTGKK
jgi:hypothetical protein